MYCNSMASQLKRLLDQRDMTEQQLADAVGVSRFRICRLVRGNFKSRRKERKRIASALGLSVRDVFGTRPSRSRKK